eukprot:1061320-Amphidinium_carterae.1
MTAGTSDNEDRNSNTNNKQTNKQTNHNTQSSNISSSCHTGMLGSTCAREPQHRMQAHLKTSGEISAQYAHCRRKSAATKLTPVQQTYREPYKQSYKSGGRPLPIRTPKYFRSLKSVARSLKRSCFPKDTAWGKQTNAF